MTEWSVDFKQLSDLYVEMGGQDEGIARLDGFLEVRLSENETHVSAENFTVTKGDVLVMFEKIQIDLMRGQTDGNGVAVKGHVDQDGVRKGEFSIEQGTDSGAR